MARPSSASKGTRSVYLYGLDPGTANFGLAIQKVNLNTRAFTPVYSGKVANTVKHTMDNLPEQYADFLSEILERFQKYPPHGVIFERFMNRGKFAGDTGEYVSMMIALVVYHLQVHYPKCEVRVTQPNTWKTAFNRLWGAASRKGGVKLALDKIYDFALCESHEIDAYIMSHFLLSDLTGDLPYTHLRDPAVGGKQLILDLEAVATGKKKRKRKT